MIDKNFYKFILTELYDLTVFPLKLFPNPTTPPGGIRLYKHFRIQLKSDYNSI